MANKIEILINAKDQFSGAFGKLGSILPGVGKALAAAGAAATAAATGVVAMAKSTAEAYDSVGKFSSRIGISTEALSAYHHVAERSGISQETLNMGFQRMTRRISEASRGTGVAVNTLRELGISIDSISDKKPDEQFEMIAKALDGVAHQGDKARIAMQFFDSEGVALLQTLSNGSAGLKEMKEEAEKFGLIISSRAAANAAEFNDSLTRMKGAIVGTRNAISERFLPALTRLSNQFAEFVANNRDKIVDFFIDTSIFAVDAAAKISIGVINIIAAIDSAIASIEAKLDKFKGTFETIKELTIGNLGTGELEQNLESIQANSGSLVRTFKILDESGQSVETTFKGIGNSFDVEEAKSKITDLAETIKSELAGALLELGDFRVPSDEDASASIENINAMTEAQLAAYEILLAAHDEYYLSEEERLYEWYLTQQELYAGHKEALATLDEVYQAKEDALIAKRRKAKANREKEERKEKEKRLRDEANFRINLFRTTEDALYAIQTIIGKKGFETMKKIRIAAAVITGIQAAINAWNAGLSTGGPYAPAIAAAYVVASLAFTAARISAIQSQQYPSAHGGLEYVPNEQTYLLNRGERVLSPRQNEDLTNAIEDGSIGGGGTFNIENFNLSIHVPDADGLISLSSDDWDVIAQERVLPAFRRLAIQGQTI